MVDFWMTIGRLLTNETVLDTFLKDLPPKDYPINVSLRGFDFEEEDYSRARNALVKGLQAAGLPVYPVSLMTLGELLYTTSSPAEHATLRKVVTMMKDVGSERDGLFYTGLGALMVDPGVRRQLEEQQYEQAMFGGLSDSDKQMLTGYASDPHFRVASNSFEDLWIIDCFVRSTYYSGHTHPATPPAIDRFMVKNNLAHAAGAGGGGASPYK